MNKDKLWLELYKGREINCENFSDFFSPNGQNTDEYIHYIENEETGIVIRVYAYISNDHVTQVDVLKSLDLSTGHAYGSFEERNLSAAEKKKVREIFDACFPDQARGEIDAVINQAIERKVEYQGYAILRTLKNGVSFVSPEGTKGTLQRERILQALNFSHVDLRILFELETVVEFSACYGKQPWQPLAAILSVVDPTTYAEYEQLNLQYRKTKFNESIQKGSLSDCVKYEDALIGSSQEFVDFVSFSIANKHRHIFDWFMEKVSGLDECNLSQALFAAIQADDYYAVDCIFNSGKLFPESGDLHDDWHTPMRIAASKNNVEVQKRLLKLGYPGKIDEALLSIDELKEYLAYPLEINIQMWKRASRENRRDILDIITQRKLNDQQSNWVMIRYAEDQSWDAFLQGLSAGYDPNGYTLFETCWLNGHEWTDKLLEHGFDINQDNGKLLHRAVEHRDLVLTKYLVEHGADIIIKESHDGSLLEKSVNKEGHWGNIGPVNEELCLYLLEKGADPLECLNDINHYGGQVRKNAFDLLIKSDRINCVDEEGHLPIYYVASQFQPQDDGTIEYLISNGAYVDANGICDDKLFYHVYQNYFDFPHVWKAFISAGANVSEVHSFGQPANTRSALYYALQRNAPIEHFEALLEAGAYVNELLHPIVRAYYTKPKPRPKTPLDMARNAEREDLVTLFLKYGALTYDQIEQTAP